MTETETAKTSAKITKVEFPILLLRSGASGVVNREKKKNKKKREPRACGTGHKKRALSLEFNDGQFLLFTLSASQMLTVLHPNVQRLATEVEVYIYNSSLRASTSSKETGNVSTELRQFGSSLKTRS